jgi:outer membrane biosynthesis protein TonB
MKITAADLRERLMAEKSALERDITEKQNHLTTVKNDLQLLDRQTWSFDLPDPEPIVRIVPARPTRKTTTKPKSKAKTSHTVRGSAPKRSPEARENMRIAQREAWKRRRDRTAAAAR